MKFKIITLYLITCAVALGGCSKEDNAGPGYEYTYKLTGPATSKLIVQYTPTMTDPDMAEVPDNLEYEEEVTPPWEKTVRLHKNVAGAGFSASVSDGIPGAGYTISILDKDDKILKTANFVVDADGYAVALLNYYRD